MSGHSHQIEAARPSRAASGADYTISKDRRRFGAQHKMEDFDKLVEWAYSTLPQKVRSLPDFPGIQVVDEPPPDLLKEMVADRTISPRSELLGLYSGTHRTKRSFFQLKYAPDLIFVFRGPILRC